VLLHDDFPRDPARPEGCRNGEACRERHHEPDDAGNQAVSRIQVLKQRFRETRQTRSHHGALMLFQIMPGEPHDYQ
jgi:hypothetical protein